MPRNYKHCFFSAVTPGTHITHHNGPTGKKLIKSFNFDRVFGVYSRQEEVFDSMVRPIVDEVCWIFPI